MDPRPGSVTEVSGLNRSVGVQVGTYNVNGRIPSPGLDLSKWLDASSEPDIVAVAFQEIVPLSASNVVMGETPVLYLPPPPATRYLIQDSRKFPQWT